MAKKNIQALVTQLAVHDVFGQFRYFKKDNGEIWFVAVDVAKILDIEQNFRNNLANFPDDEKKKFDILTAVYNTHGEVVRNVKESVWCVNEPGLYRLIFSSRKPEAEKFKRWIFHEVLPSIRATGSYSLPQKKEVKEITNGNLVKKVLEKYPDAEPELIDISFSEDEDGNITTHYHFGYQLPDGTFI